MKRAQHLVVLGLLALVFCAPLRGGVACADVAHVAVAANFTEAAKEIAAAFKAKTGHDALLSFGSSGQFFTQIKESAPFEAFLSADSVRPQALSDEGFAVEGSRFTYAIGKLVLWSRRLDVSNGGQTLRGDGFLKLAIANPAAAPYGAAALEVLKRLGLEEALRPKIVQGNSIAQAFQFVSTGNAELGFVALSQLAGVAEGSRWIVPQQLYAEIRQDAVLLKTGASNPAARAFLEFLRGPEARRVLEKNGYALPSGS